MIAVDGVSPPAGTDCPHGHVPETCTACHDAKTVALLRERIKDLEAGLQPFAHFAEQFARKPLAGMADTFYAIHTGTEWAAELKRSDCERAALLLVGMWTRDVDPTDR